LEVEMKNLRGTRRRFRLGMMALTACTAMALALPAASMAASREKPGQVVSEYFVSIDELRASGLLTDETDLGSGPQPDWWCVFGCTSVKNVVYVNQTNAFVTQVKGSPGPMTLTLSGTYSVANSFSANVGVTADVVSAGVGFSVTWTASQTYSASTSVPTGACRIIKAYNTFNNYSFDVWQDQFIGDPYKIGSGVAHRFIGVWYQVVTC
jgi:hypothetical protein